MPSPSKTEDNLRADQSEWFCLRAQIKREHIAASMLGRTEGVEVFCPRISQVKKTRTGKKRFVDALFPGYLFACFHYDLSYRLVIHTQGITGIVQQGVRTAIPDRIIEQLKETFPEPITEAPDPSIEPGAEIEVITGSLSGLKGKVIAALPANNRIQILLEFLGREITVSVTTDSVLLSKRY
jgi:transcriptional antiterminator RfaH